MVRSCPLCPHCPLVSSPIRCGTWSTLSVTYCTMYVPHKLPASIHPGIITAHRSAAWMDSYPPPSPFLPSFPSTSTNKRIAQQTKNQLSHISALPQLQKSLYLTLSSGKFVRDSHCQQKTRFQSLRTNPVIASCNRSPRFFGKPSESTPRIPSPSALNARLVIILWRAYSTVG